MRIIPNIWCDGTALEAAEFYAGVFRDAAITKIVTYPEDGLPDFQAHMAGRPLTVDVEIHGRPLTLINAGPEFRPNHSISFLLNFDPAEFGDDGDDVAKRTDLARAYLDQVHDALIDGGGAMMELGEYPHSPRYAWIHDRYGVTWQLMLTDPDGDPRPFLTPSFMFGGTNQDNAREATDFWIGVLDDSSRGALVEYEHGAVMFTDFRLAGDWFAAMDSAVPQDMAFTEGISLMVECRPGDELDRVWEALSADPAAEVCGWCKDRYGVSWQVVPDTMDELMAKPGAYATMMGMKKIDPDGF
ncbi:VOC family protein [Corynebacterium sp. NPDC060344]|uniref:VOC family protein n=1 Tax=Corynebacterium sp. NPDC060344 TaxID=3347101 RepID=UPI00365F91C1